MPALGGGTINLLPKSEFEASLWGRVLHWSLTAGRYIIIITELVVIMAFMSRFKLDKDLSDLADAISGKKAILEALSNTEKNFRMVQKRLISANQLINSGSHAGETLELITTQVPPGITLTGLTWQPKNILLSATADNKQALGEFLQRLAQQKKWLVLNLTDLSTENQSGIKFNLTINY